MPKDPLHHALRKKESPRRNRVTKDKREMYFTWLHLNMVLQLSVSEIVRWEERENGRTVPNYQVRRGLDWAYQTLGDSMARSDMQKRHRELADRTKRKLLTEFERILKMASQNNGYGIATTETTQETIGGKTKKVTTKTKLQSHIPELIALSREIREWDKFQSLLAGLMQTEETDNAPKTIEVVIPGFEDAIFTNPEDAPQLPEPKKLEDIDGEE